MNILEIIKKRNCGRVRASFSSHWNSSLNQLLLIFGLAPSPESLIEVSKEKAMKIIETLLQKDLAYSSKIMSKKQAEKYSNVLISALSTSKCKYYTNGEWHKYHSANNAFCFTGLTESTFDGGVLIVSKRHAFVFWVEDED